MCFKKLCGASYNACLFYVSLCKLLATYHDVYKMLSFYIRACVSLCAGLCVGPVLAACVGPLGLVFTMFQNAHPVKNR